MTRERKTSDITLDLGRMSRDPVLWHSKEVINGHMIVAGPSGAGKSYTVRRVVRTLATQSAHRIIVIDVHGDLDFPDHCHTIRFSEQSEYGLSPLEISDDPDMGGVRRRCNAFINLLERQNALGSAQKAALNRLMIGLYQRFGFYYDKPETWSLNYDPRPNSRYTKRYPTLTDLKNLVWERLLIMKTGASPGAVRALQEVFRQATQRKRFSTHLRNQNDASKKADLEKVLGVAQDKAIEAFTEAVRTADTGTELEDIIHWNNADTVKTLFDRLESLERCGIFKGKDPVFPEAARIWRYDISCLTSEEQQLFVDVLLTRIYQDAKQAGHADGPDTFVVLDEAHKFITDNDDAIINILWKEIRKFGVGMVFASQSLDHYSIDILTSAATKIILGCPEILVQRIHDKLGLAKTIDHAGKPVSPLARLRSQHTALVGVSRHGRSLSLSEVEINGLS